MLLTYDTSPREGFTVLQNVNNSAKVGAVHVGCAADQPAALCDPVVQDRAARCRGEVAALV
jgi:hypothetical protein